MIVLHGNLNGTLGTSHHQKFFRTRDNKAVSVGCRCSQACATVGVITSLQLSKIWFNRCRTHNCDNRGDAPCSSGLLAHRDPHKSKYTTRSSRICGTVCVAAENRLKAPS